MDLYCCPPPKEAQAGPSGARRAGRGQAVTHGHADAEGGRGCASVMCRVTFAAVTEHAASNVTDMFRAAVRPHGQTVENSPV